MNMIDDDDDDVNLDKGFGTTLNTKHRVENHLKQEADGDLNAVKDVKKASKRAKLTDEMLLETKTGIPRLVDEFDKIKFRGEGHEVADIDRLVRLYYEWGHQLFPKLNFEALFERIARMGAVKKMSTWSSEQLSMSWEDKSRRDNALADIDNALNNTNVKQSDVEEERQNVRQQSRIERVRELQAEDFPSESLSDILQNTEDIADALPQFSDQHLLDDETITDLMSQQYHEIKSCNEPREPKEECRSPNCSPVSTQIPALLQSGKQSPSCQSKMPSESDSGRSSMMTLIEKADEENNIPTVSILAANTMPIVPISKEVERLDEDVAIALQPCMVKRKIAPTKNTPYKARVESPSTIESSDAIAAITSSSDEMMECIKNTSENEETSIAKQ